jgi:hypothetical protein
MIDREYLFNGSGCQNRPDPAGRLHARVGRQTGRVLHNSALKRGWNYATTPLPINGRFPQYVVVSERRRVQDIEMIAQQSRQTV